MTHYFATSSSYCLLPYHATGLLGIANADLGILSNGGRLHRVAGS